MLPCPTRCVGAGECWHRCGALATLQIIYTAVRPTAYFIFYLYLNIAVLIVQVLLYPEWLYNDIVIGDANRYPLSAAMIGYQKYPSIPIAGNNISPIGIGSYRLPPDLQPLVQDALLANSSLSLVIILVGIGRGDCCDTAVFVQRTIQNRNRTSYSSMVPRCNTLYRCCSALFPFGGSMRGQARDERYLLRSRRRRLLRVSEPLPVHF